MSDQLKLPENPDLEQLKRQAKELLDQYRAGDSQAVSAVKQHHPSPPENDFALHDAQLVIAGSYGFESWPKLREHVNRATVRRLNAAVRAGDLATVRSLLDRRPELVHMDTAENDEHRAIHHAVLANRPEMVRILMAAGSDARKGIYPFRDATTAYTLAVEREYHEIVVIIESEEQHRREANSCPNATVSPAQDQLNDMIRKGNTDGALAMLQSDPTLIKACDRGGGTPLHVAAESLNAPLVQWLLENRADVKKRDLAARTPLDRATRAVEWRRKGTLDRLPAVAELLRSRGAELTFAAAVALGESDFLQRADKAEILNPSLGLLSLAVNHRRPDMLDVLLDLGLDPNERRLLPNVDEPVYTAGQPLWHAAGAGYTDCAQILLSRGADPNAQVYASGTPTTTAYGQRNRAMVNLLTHHGGAIDPTTAFLFRDTDFARRFFADTDPAELHRPLPAGGALIEELLWGAACGGDPEIVRMCLDRVDWPRTDPRWYRILAQPLSLWNHGPGHWVAPDGVQLDRSTYPVCFKLILDRCDPNIPGRRNTHMLHVVAAAGTTWGVPVMTTEERLTFATMLLDAGARFGSRDDILQSTPLGWAIRWNRPELAKLLIDRGAPIHEPDAPPHATPQAWARKSRNPTLIALVNP